MNLHPLLTLLVALPLAACGGPRGRDRGDPRDQVDAGRGGRDAAVELEGLTEYGRGDYAILLSAEPRRFCWFTEETDRVCDTGSGGRRDTYVRNVCFDDELNCLSVQPEDSTAETAACFTRVTYENVSRGPLFGTCAQIEAYFDGADGVQCLFHGHCPTGRKCADYRCVCPEGVECGCNGSRPLQGPRCEGDVVVSDRVAEGCDANGDAIILEDRTDCADLGQVCRYGACVTAEGAPDGGSGGPGGPTDGGSTTAPDAGACECPPVAPPSCDTDGSWRAITCDPATCEITDTTLECADNGQRCDPAAGCVDVECLDASDCPPVGPLPAGQCADVMCVDNACVSTIRAC